MKNKIDIKAIEQFYTVTEDGRVWSKIKNRWLKPQVNSCHYLHVCISKGVSHSMWIFCHTLVALKYIGEPPTEKHEINHKDNNRANNHYTNVEWVTKSQNHLLAYKNGKDHYWLNKHRPSPSVEALIKMANAKKKRILYKSATQEIMFDSIEDCASGLGTYRKKVYLCLKNGRTIQGGYLSIAVDESNTFLTKI